MQCIVWARVPAPAKEGLYFLEWRCEGEEASVSPQPVRDAYLLYESSVESIASPSPYNGVIEGIAPGTCTITVRDDYGRMERHYTVVVTEDVEPEPEPQPDPEPIEPSTVAYLCTSGDNGAWSKGSGSSLDFRFERSENDHLAFGHFTGVLVDGNPVDGSKAYGRAGVAELEACPAWTGLSSAQSRIAQGRLGRLQRPPRCKRKQGNRSQSLDGLVRFVV